MLDLLPDTVSLTAPPIGKVIFGVVWPKSTLAIMGRDPSSFLVLTILVSNSFVIPVFIWNLPNTIPRTPTNEGR